MPAGDGHFSRAPIARRLEQPTRKSYRTGSIRPPMARAAGGCSLFGLAPGGVYIASPVTRPAGELLPHRFTLTQRPGESDRGGLLSVALSLASRPVGVTHHLILRSPDFPPAACPKARDRRPPGPLSIPVNVRREAAACKRRNILAAKRWGPRRAGRPGLEALRRCPGARRSIQILRLAGHLP